ncbi:alpha/beta fold hydrolase [Streptomyces sp. BI20]|uniref:alpha/beta fold hydrolase n=1 Tax=Streptomyces sp. BI20 TaxID=3403460 RepID=UPI003C730DF6
MTTIDAPAARPLPAPVPGPRPGLLLVHGTPVEPGVAPGGSRQRFTERLAQRFTVLGTEVALCPGLRPMTAHDALVDAPAHPDAPTPRRIPSDLLPLVDRVLAAATTLAASTPPPHPSTSPRPPETARAPLGTPPPVDVIGFSLGAVAAAATAALRPERVRRLILVGGRVGGDRAASALSLDLWRSLADLDPEAFARFAALTLHSPRHLDSLDELALDDLLAELRPDAEALRRLEAARRLDLTDLLGSVTAPTLVVAGRQDRLVPLAEARALHAAVPGSRFATLDSGHLPLAETPEALTTLISDFLDTPTTP